MLGRAVGLVLLMTAVAVPTLPQNPSSNSQAIVLANQVLKVLDGGTTIDDVVLQAAVHFTAGSDEENGTSTLTARGSQESRVVLNLDGGERQEIRRGQSGAWIPPGGQAHPISTHNAWTDASWFFPALSLEALLSDPQLALLYVGQEARDSLTVHHLRVSRLIAGQDAQFSASTQRLSTMDIFIDSGSLLPVALAFATHPDNDAGIDIPVEIQFSDYRLAGGVSAPFRVRKLLQGSLLLDLSVGSVTVNSGVPESEFNLPGGQP